ncbi:hypothetical protein NHE_0734 [Neorickettsia helminthoeca str. Oregon]|uniref:Uncharacterized protein n=1 Tax=Neorickettsia helminthoeca str. Oregon TaxID=1286528 RepID=X5H516_9RICK|nr:hypothetical protein [Neorickettsia helminthoeca]AHX11666.1 hypothetical protein NHE_0734 [Neorickettsia helminthoeca str. Oregon]
MQSTRNLLTQLREVRRQISTSDLPVRLKLAYFKQELAKSCARTLGESSASEKVQAVLNVTDTILNNSGTRGLHSFASEALKHEQINGKILQQAGIPTPHMYPTIDISKGSAGRNVGACVARMYCAFIKDTVESSPPPPPTGANKVMLEGSQKEVTKR